MKRKESVFMGGDQVKKLVTLLFGIIIVSQLIFAGSESKPKAAVYLYNFKPATFHLTNKFMGIDKVMNFKPSLQIEIKGVQDREFSVSASLSDAEGKSLMRKTQKVKRVAEDNSTDVIVTFWLEDKIPLPEKAVVDFQGESGSWSQEVELQFVRVQGKSTNFDGTPRKDYVFVNDSGFETDYVSQCDDNGRYQMVLPKRAYNALLILNETYAEETVETWALNFNAYKDMEINFKVGGLELYNLHAWPNNGGAPTLFVSFRAMSIHRLNLMDLDQDGKFSEQEVKAAKMMLSLPEFNENPFVGLTPGLDKDKVKVFLDGKEASVVSLQTYPEYAGGKGEPQFTTAYLVQVLRGANKLQPGRHSIRVVIQDELDYRGEKIVEMGEGWYYWLQESSVHTAQKYNY